MEIFLDEYGYDVVSAGNGQEAWYLFQKENFDLVLTDICMPGMNGNDLAKYMKNHRKALPIIAMTGSSWLAEDCFDEIMTKRHDQCGLIRWVRKQAPGAWKRIAIRDSSKGKIFVDILHRIIWLWDGKETEARRWHLVVRREIDSPEEIKYSLSNAPLDTPTERLAFMQAQRYWVERPFQDAKNQCGMGDYQARGWFAWHHHMSMVLLAMLFMLEQRLQHQPDIPLLSCPDVATLLKSVLPRKDITEEEVLRQLEVRHRKRQASIDAAYRKQQKDGLLPLAACSSRLDQKSVN